MWTAIGELMLDVVRLLTFGQRPPARSERPECVVVSKPPSGGHRRRLPSE